MRASMRTIVFAACLGGAGGCSSCVKDESPPIPTPAATSVGDASHFGIKMLGRGSDSRRFVTRDAGAEGNPP